MEKNTGRKRAFIPETMAHLFVGNLNTKPILFIGFELSKMVQLRHKVKALIFRKYQLSLGLAVYSLIHVKPEIKKANKMDFRF
jgi:hypothetical protein